MPLRTNFNRIFLARLIQPQADKIFKIFYSITDVDSTYLFLPLKSKALKNFLLLSKLQLY